MKNKTFILLTLFLVVFTLGYSQGKDKGSTQVQVLGSKNANFNLINSGFMGMDGAQKNKEVALIKQNSVYIQQIGTDNKIDSSVKSSDADVKLHQNGKNNTMQVNLSADKIREQLAQNGNNNLIIHEAATSAKNIPINTEVTQNGNDMSATVHGANSISKGMKIKQTQASRSIIVRNF